MTRQELIEKLRALQPKRTPEQMRAFALMVLEKLRAQESSSDNLAAYKEAQQ